MTVFLSYASEDRFFSELLQSKLEADGIGVWRDVTALHGGDDWRHSIDRGISESQIVVLVLSNASCASHYVTYEWASAMGRGKPILPLLIEQCDRHPKIEPIQYIDFLRHDASTWARVVQRVKDMVAELEVPQNENEQDLEAASSTRLDTKEIHAQNQIVAYLNERGFRMMSFERIQNAISNEYDDSFLKTLATKRDQLALAYLKGPKLGLKLR